MALAPDLDSLLARAVASTSSGVGFKGVNDTYGHLAGDRVLAEVASRLQGALRSGDVLGRHGGDEFVAVLVDLDPLDAARVAERAAQDVCAALARTVPVGTESVQVAGSVGIALLPDDGSTGAALLLAADTAMYAAKQSRRLPAN